ncbi:MAG: MerR family transcriptional regulator [Flavobacteriales bacterium]
MPYKSKEIEKLYYSIGEVADMFGVNTSLIRFWEKEFDIITPQKNKKGNRLFTKKDIENFQKIFELVKEKGFTLNGAKVQLKKKSSVSQSSEDSVLDKLNQIKATLLSIKSKL